MSTLLTVIAVASYFVSSILWNTAPSVMQQILAGLIGVAGTMALVGAAIVDRLDQLLKKDSQDPKQRETDLGESQ